MHENSTRTTYLHKYLSFQSEDGDGFLLCDMIDTKTLELLIVLFKERFVVGPLVLLLGPGQSPNCWETSQELETCGRIQIRAERGTVER